MFRTSSPRLASCFFSSFTFGALVGEDFLETAAFVLSALGDLLRDEVLEAGDLPGKEDTGSLLPLFRAALLLLPLVLATLLPPGAVIGRRDAGEVVLGIEEGVFNPLLLVIGREGDDVIFVGVVFVVLVGFLRAEVLNDVIPVIFGLEGRVSLVLLVCSALLDTLLVALDFGVTDFPVTCILLRDPKFVVLVCAGDTPFFLCR